MGNIWQPTMELRWYIDTTAFYKVLQQKWINDLGVIEWREIKTHNVNDIGNIA